MRTASAILGAVGSVTPPTSVGASDAVRESLSTPSIHDTWEEVYRSRGNEEFYERAFDDLVRRLPPASPEAALLDVGCGVGAHAVRLARRGFRVEAVDFSQGILERTRANVRANGLEDQIAVSRGDLLSLPYPEERFEYVLCWGVLMHVPEVARALSELARVTQPGGVLIVYELNARSPEARLMRAALPRLARRPITLKRTPAGVEHWTVTPSGPLMWRHADIDWLLAELAARGFALRSRRAGQLTELYDHSPAGWITAAIHGLNVFWFERVRAPGPAVANVLVLQKVY